MTKNKDIYILRHGQSTANAQQLRNGPNFPLSEEGREQTKLAGRKIATLNLDVIISSPLVRTRETSEIINKEANLPLEYDLLFQERRTPTEIMGLPVDDQLSLKIIKEIKKNFKNPDWHYSNEENFYDLKKRTKKVLKMITERPEERILLICHSFYMRFLHAYILHREDITVEDFEKIYYSYEIRNTGINHYTLTENFKDKAGPRFILKTWSDTSHLD